MATSPQIVMVPFMAQGHVIPFLALAKLIEQRNPNCTITLVSTPLNIQNLQSSLPTHSNIHLQSLPFDCVDHGLPPNSDNTDSLPSSSLIMTLMLATETLEPHFDRLISDIADRQGRHSLSIVGDVFCGWTVAVAKKHNIFHTTFTTCGCYGTAAYMSLWLNLPHLKTTAQEFRIPGFPETYTFDRSQMSPFMKATDGTDAGSVFFQKHISQALRSNAMICNSIEEVEPLGVQVLRELITGMKLWTIGPLLLPRAGRCSGIELDDCIEWLDSHPAASVVYVSFGSQNSITRSQMMEMAKGLEASGKPFIWVVRPPIGFDLYESFREDWLPEEFEARVGGSKQGLVVRNWAPQLEILSHESTGVFLSHCGWNSVLESLSRGVPMIAWPLAAEQFFNSKMLEEELGVSVELTRGVESDIVSGDIERVVKLVSSDEKGRRMKEKAVGVAEMIRHAMEVGDDQKGSSIMALDDFLETVISERSKDIDVISNGF